MANYTPEQALQLNIKTMGEALGRLHYTLTRELVWLHVKWEQYVELYGTKPSRVDLINQVAGLFFKIVEDALWEDTLLHIARLTDPEQTGRNKNLTIRRLSDPNLIRDSHIRQTIEELLEVAIDKSRFARDWRNRRIAHRDFALAMEEDAKPLDHASRAHVKEALRSISDVLNAISGHYKNSEMCFDHPKKPRGALSLLYVIDDGLRAGQERKDRVLSGRYTPEDYKHRFL